MNKKNKHNNSKLYAPITIGLLIGIIASLIIAAALSVFINC